jgi:hypothetical protein
MRYFHNNFVELLEDSELIKFNTEKMEELSQTCFSLRIIRDNLLKEDIKWFEERVWLLFRLFVMKEK